jgi:hypothetical protein
LAKKKLNLDFPGKKYGILFGMFENGMFLGMITCAASASVFLLPPIIQHEEEEGGRRKKEEFPNKVKVDVMI